jgi:signal transduction histidine kinase
VATAGPTAGAMSASFAHELSQPLSTIALNADTALRTFEDGPRGAEQLKEALDEICEANQHALQIMRHMRGLLKHQSDVQLQEFDVSEVIADALRILLPEAKKRDISLSTTDIRHRLPVRADPIHLQQVILNLAINGMDTDAIARKITIQAALDGASWIEVSVNDSGKGIAERELSKIFETFYTTKPEGTGLGLSIARNIIESYGGKIWAECRPGGGTSFRFNLPLATTH